MLVNQYNKIWAPTSTPTYILSGVKYSVCFRNIFSKNPEINRHLCFFLWKSHVHVPESMLVLNIS